jgi:DNA mismatch repair protein MutS
MTLFATHYHELTDLATTHKRIQNYSIAVREWNDSIIFLHKLVRGATNRSYGVQVAGLAGVPDHVVKRAHQILANIERGELTWAGKPAIAVSDSPQTKMQPCQLPLFQPEEDPVQKLLGSVNVDEISPRQAMELLYQLSDLMKNKP